MHVILIGIALLTIRRRSTSILTMKNSRPLTLHPKITLSVIGTNTGSTVVNQMSGLLKTFAL